MSCCPHDYATRPKQDKFPRLLLIAEIVRLLMQWQNVRLMGKPHRWQTRWLKKYPLGPYAFQNRMEKQLRRKVHLANFSFDMEQELLNLGDSLPEVTITWLYEACLRARSEKATVEVARTIFGSKSWKKWEQERNNLRTQLKVFAEYDADSRMRKALRVGKDHRMNRRAMKLARDLREFGEQCRFWKPYAAWGAWQKDYRRFVCLLDAHLRKRHPDLLKRKIRRVEVIRFAIDTIGLKAASEDSISRMLNRYSKKKPSRSKGTRRRSRAVNKRNRAYH